jgi:hypothetical protein
MYESCKTTNDGSFNEFSLVFDTKRSILINLTITGPYCAHAEHLQAVYSLHRIKEVLPIASVQ